MTDNHLNDTLIVLRNNTRQYIYLVQIRWQLLKLYPTITLLETLLTVEKLVRDGYATEEPQQANTAKRGKVITEVWYGYFISFEGIELLENGGYPALRIRQADERSFQERRLQSEVNLIDSNLTTNGYTKANVVLGLLFVGLAALMSILTYRITSAQMQSEQKTEQLQTIMTQQDRLLQIQQMQIDSLLIITARRDTLIK
jgi:hypothetical protein